MNNFPKSSEKFIIHDWKRESIPSRRGEGGRKRPKPGRGGLMWLVVECKKCRTRWKAQGQEEIMETVGNCHVTCPSCGEQEALPSAMLYP
jgi:hypothetical protein